MLGFDASFELIKLLLHRGCSFLGKLDSNKTENDKWTRHRDDKDDWNKFISQVRWCQRPPVAQLPHNCHYTWGGPGQTKAKLTLQKGTGKLFIAVIRDIQHWRSAAYAICW